MMAEIGQTISSSLNIHEVYKVMGEKVNKLLPFDRLSINLVDDASQTTSPTWQLGANIPGREAAAKVPFAGSLTGQVVRTRSPVMLEVESAAEIERCLPLLLPAYDAGFRSFLSVPLVDRDAVIGVLQIRSKTQGIYSHRHLELAIRVANQIAGAIANAQLYSQRVIAEEAMRASELKYRTLMKDSPDMIFISRIDDFKFSEVNDRACGTYGYTYQEFLSLTVFDLEVSPPLKQEVRSLYDNTPVGEVIEVYGTNKRKDGTTFPVHVRFAKLDDEYAIANVRDITQQKEAEQDLQNAKDNLERAVEERTSELKASNERLKDEVTERRRAEEVLFQQGTAMNSASDGISIVDAKGEFVYVNKAFVRMYGYNGPDERIGRNHLQTRRELVRFDNEILPELIRNGSWQGETIGQRKDGSGFPQEISMTSLEDGGLVCTDRDITERRQAEQRMHETARLASIGELAAGIGHEINTPTQYIGDNIRFFQESFSDIQSLLDKYQKLLKAVQSEEPAQEIANEIGALIKEIELDYLSEEVPIAIEQSLEGNSRVAEIVRAMKEFAHPGLEEMTAIDVNHAISNTIAVARNEWKYVADVVTNFDLDLPEVPCLPGSFNQVMLNILVNAAHAIAEVVKDDSEKKGTITVTTRSIDGWAEIRIQDTGPGIPEKIRTKIFDPFFTTKDPGKGTGQGLALVHAVIVEKHKGTIQVETEPGKGTTFIVRVPLALIHEPEERPETVAAEIGG